MAERALSVLLSFLAAKDELGVSEIARHVGMAKGGVHRYLMAFEQNGLVSQNPRTKRYGLGFRVLELSSALTRQFDVVAQAQPFLRELRDATAETAGLAVRVGDYRVHLAQAESEHEIRQSYPIGKPLPYAGAVGKVLLAFLSERELDGLLARPLEQVTDATITDPSRLREELAQVRRQGYASSRGERSVGSQSIAAPVWSWRGDVVSINVAGPAFRFTEEKAIETTAVLRKIAARLTRELGGTHFESI